MSSRDFNDYNYFYDHIEPEMFRPLYYYLAQIAYEIVRQNMKPRWPGKIADFLIKFKGKPRPLSEEEKKQRLAQSKSFWSGVIGMVIPNKDK